MDGELNEFNRYIHKGKRVNVAFDILHIVGNSPITLLRTGKILAMGQDPSTRRRCIHLFESSPCSTRRGRGRDKLHKGGRYRPNNCIEKQLVLSEPENMIRFRKGEAALGRIIIARGHNFESSTKPSKSYPNRRDVNWNRHAE